MCFRHLSEHHSVPLLILLEQPCLQSGFLRTSCRTSMIEPVNAQRCLHLLNFFKGAGKFLGCAYCKSSLGFQKKMASILFMPAVGVCGGHFKLYQSKHVRKDSWCTSATTAMMSTLRASMWIFRTCFANYCQIVSMFFATKQVYIDGF